MKKRFFSAIFATILLTSFIGCSNNKAASDGDDTSNKAMKASEYNSSFKANAAVYKNLVTLPNYEGLEVSVDKSILDVTEEKVDEHINKILSSFSTTEQVKEGVTESGDSINGKLDGVAFAGGTATSTNYTIGSGGYIQDLDQGLIGLTVGQEYDIPCTFPENYKNSEMAGKDVIFTVTVNCSCKAICKSINSS